VTSFFRNPSVFEGPRAEVFPSILKNRSPGATIRVWTPGCASGEETYSVAIALVGFLGARSSQTQVQFFGTDVNEAGISRARTGTYPENIQCNVSAERLRRFFTKAEGGYRVSKNIRDVCIFAQHDVLTDPPFSQMDLICCRNLLIYLEPTAQSRVISLFRYATRPGGYLVLGSSEGVGSGSHLFSMGNRSLKFFSKKVPPSRPAVRFALSRSAKQTEREAPLKPHDATWNYMDIQTDFDRRLLTHYAPPTVFINDDLEILHTRGNVNRYLKLASGRPSLNVLKMAREGLLLDLRNAITRAKKDNVAVRKQNIHVKMGSGNETESSEKTQLVNLRVVPFQVNNQRKPSFMIILEDAPAQPVKERLSRKEKSETARSTKLQQELAATKEYLQAVIETQEATNEELQSANEEILSSNEELQSTNEELETAKEELQSANEELSTVNDELRSGNLEASQVNSDLTNLPGSIDLAIVMVGGDLSVRRFTPRAQTIFGLLPHDVGRPLSNINPSVELPDFQNMVRQLMADAQTIERTLTSQDGHAYRLRVVPYKLADDRIEGTVITAATRTQGEEVASDDKPTVSRFLDEGATA
jgi:two-component system, chemotaxis family, CheB/CheR fusion protein